MMRANVTIDGEQVEIGIRPALPDDEPYIFSSWLKSYRDSRFSVLSAPAQYYRGQWRMIRRLLDSYRTIVACPIDAPEVILGWACGGVRSWAPHKDALEAPHEVVHYVYVKNAMRGGGIGKALVSAMREDVIEAAPLVCTHWTRRQAPTSAEKFVYDPYGVCVG